MKGSWIAAQIEADLRRERYWKNKKTRQRCYQDGVKQCDDCMYKEICEDKEVIDDIQMQQHRI